MYVRFAIHILTGEGFGTLLLEWVGVVYIN